MDSSSSLKVDSTEILDPIVQVLQKDDIVVVPLETLEAHLVKNDHDWDDSVPFLDISKDVNVEQRVKQNLKKDLFKAHLHVYGTKNNIFWVLTDITKKNILFKRSGGIGCKRGTDKNSQKVAAKNLDQVVEVVRSLKVGTLFVNVRTAVTNKKHMMTQKSLEKLLQGLKIKDCNIYELFFNKTRIAISKIRPKYGRRGRRT